MMTRRAFVSRVLSAAAAGAVLDVDKLLWVPGRKKTFEIITAAKWNRQVVYYVSPLGLDECDGLSPLTAWRTLEHAMGRMRQGAFTHLAPGLYDHDEDIIAATSGRLEKVLR